MYKGLIILMGECFRTGNQCTRITSHPSSFDGQKEACFSHLQWIDHLQEKLGISCDLVINSYKTKFCPYLKEWYGTTCRDEYFHDNVIGWDNLYFDSISKWGHLFKHYHFVHFMRIDICLKPFFSTVFKLDDKLRYPSICFTFNNYHITYDNHPRVSDTMLYVPSKFYNILLTSRAKLLDHNGWSECINHGIASTDIDVYLSTFHDSDSAKDWNPIYRIVNRNKNNVWYSKGLIFNGTTTPSNGDIVYPE
jgi:hypothetical protein